MVKIPADPPAARRYPSLLFWHRVGYCSSSLSQFLSPLPQNYTPV